MIRVLKSLSLFSALAVVLTLFFVVGCSNTPLQSDIPEVQQIELSRGSRTPTSVNTYSQELIDADCGGKIGIQRDVFSHEFSVPGNALPADTVITVESFKGEVLGKNVIIFEFGPDGLVFSKSASLSFQIAELNPLAKSATMYYYNPLKKSWEAQSSTGVKGGIVTFEIDHFSKYAISD